MSNNKGFLIEGHYYQYDLQWLIDKLLSFEDSIKTVIDLQTIHYADPIQWNITTQYSPNTVVVDPQNGTAYMSKQAVPSGVQLSNEAYWTVIFNYQQIYEKICSGVAYNNLDSVYATKDLLVNDLVWYDLNLYRVTRAISTGGQLLPGTNLTPTNIESLLSAYYGRDRTAQVMNDTVNVTGDYTLNAGDIAETSTNRTEKVTADREIDIDGSDSIHVDGVTTINRDGSITEINKAAYDRQTVGPSTEVFEDTATSTYNGKRNITAKDITVNAAKDIAVNATKDITVNAANYILNAANYILNALAKIIKIFTGNYDADWIINHRSNPTTTATILSVSADGRAAYSGFSRTQDNPNTYDQITMGVQGIAQSDSAEKNEVVSWGGYFENRQIAGGSSFGIEVDTGRVGSDTVPFRPYDTMSLSNMCVGVNLSSGLGITDNSVDSRGADTALLIHPNPKPFAQGIVFTNDSVKQDSPFIHLPWTAKIAWQLGDLDDKSSQFITGSTVSLADVQNPPKIITSSWGDYDRTTGLDDGAPIYEQTFNDGGNVKGKFIIKNQENGCTFVMQTGVDGSRKATINQYAAIFENMQLEASTLKLTAAASPGTHADTNLWIPITVGDHRYYLKLYS